MKRTNKIILSAILIVVLLIGIGYAAITSVTLNIAGTAEADPNQSNFLVKFTGETNESDKTKVTANVTNDTNATIKVVGLSAKGESEYAEYTIQNVSKDISADLKVETTNNNPEYFTIKSELEKTSLKAGEVTKVTVTIELTKTPIDKAEATVGVQITAMPVEPGKEGTSDGINGSSQTPEQIISGELGELVTNDDNIGDYIDLGNDALGNEETTNDWRILYIEGNKVYAILADYLPNSTGYAASAGLSINGKYRVYSTINRNTLLTGLTTGANWIKLANGISGATVTGAPTPELLMKSYNEKNKTSLNYTNDPTLSSSTEDYDLYVPHTTGYEGCYGYWLALPYKNSTSASWGVRYDGLVSDYSFTIESTPLGVRPVVSLPSSINVELINEVWTVTKQNSD